LGIEFLQQGAVKFHSLTPQIRVRKLSHQYEQQFRVFWRGDAVYRLQVFQIRVAQLRVVPVTAAKRDKSHNEQESHRENCDCASNPWLCLGRYFDLLLGLHMLSPPRPSLWLVSNFNCALLHER